MQSDSTHDPGTTPDTRSLTDLWRDAKDRLDAWDARGFSPLRDDASAGALEALYQRMDEVADRRDTVQTIRDHAQVEHPDVAWDDQATTFATGRFAEGRAR